MSLIRLNDRISIIEASECPLSSAVGIIKDDDKVWLYDVGNSFHNISGLTDRYHIVLSHFHADHIGNIEKSKLKLYMYQEKQMNTFTT